MQELCEGTHMFIPEYTITPKILANIGIIEHCKGITESTTMLGPQQKQLQREAKFRIIHNNLIMHGSNVNPDTLKRYVDGLIPAPSVESSNLMNGFEVLRKYSSYREIDELVLKDFHRELSSGLTTKIGTYRSIKIPQYIKPEEILAEMVEFFDWYSSIEAKETHPVLLAALVKAEIERIIPFEVTNTLVANFLTYQVLQANGYIIEGFYCLEDFYNKSKHSYEHNIYSISTENPDFTEWLEYFTDGLAVEINTIKDKVLLLARDTKLAKATGRHKLSARQQRIVEYLQDYGILTNREFPKLFPDKSEDSILRDLKALIALGIIVKAGSTKSSRYELA